MRFEHPWKSSESTFDEQSLDFLRMELLCYGVRSKRIYRGRKGGAGPAGGRCFILPNGDVVDAPMMGEFIKDSPFELKKHDGRWTVYRTSGNRGV